MKQPYLLLILVLLCILFSTSLSAQTETEPNDISSKASILPLNNTASGAVAPKGDVDWWQVKTNDDGELDLTLQNLSKSGIIHLQLFDSDAVSLLHDTLIEAHKLITLPTDGRGAGVYFIRVSCANVNDTASYILSDTLIRAAEPNDVEPNNIKYLQQTPINANDTIRGHIGYRYNGKIDHDDWYVFTTTYDGAIYFTFNNESLKHQLRATLSDSVNDIFGFFPIPQTTRSDGYRGFLAGTYFIRISNDIISADTGFGGYRFSIFLDSVKHPNDNEPNGSSSTALQLQVNDSAQGHIGYVYDNYTDSADWYRVNLTADGMFKIDLSSDSINNQAYFSFYDSNATTLLKKGFVYGHQRKTFLIDGLAKGVYYLKIYGYRPAAYATYTVRDSLPTYLLSDSLSENNNAPYLAKVIAPDQNIEAHTGFYYNNHRDTTDWWQLNYDDASSNLQLDFHLLPALIDKKIKSLQVQLFSDTLAAPVYAGVIADSLDTVIITGLKQGLYYLKLSCDAASNWCAYSFKASFNDGVLATTFLNFSGSIQNNKPVLQWLTTGKTNSKGFDVESSVDGFNFYKISFVEAKHNSTATSYIFTDNTASTGRLYYRLKEIDNSGSYIYSSIVLLNVKNVNWYVSYEQKDCKVFLQLSQSSKTILQVICANGTVIQTIDKGNLAAGNYAIPLNLNNQPPGIYTVRLLLDGAISCRQFFKP